MSIGRKKIEDGFKTPQERYESANVTRYALKINRNTDADILEWLEAQPNKQGAIKQAIRSYLASNRLDGTNPTTETLKDW